jgi:ATP-dependent DNA helicase UvrD/PcrA
VFGTADGWGELGLNEAQQAAVDHRGGPLLVVAGAGSGKTRTIVARLAGLLAEGFDPDRLLLLTFSRRAATEMLQRAEGLGAGRMARGVWGGTFHAMANRMLREHGSAVGLAPGFTILDQADAADLLGVVRSQLGLGERGRRFPKKETLLDVYSRVANAQQRLGDVLAERFPWCETDHDDLRVVFGAYADRKRALGVLDYDDLLLYWRALVTASPAAGMLARRFEHVLVDEYQDTNLLQADIVAGLTPSGAGLFVVGDDAQAIYGFRAASAANMVDFTDRFTQAAVVTLARNYRSIQPVLDVANAVMVEARGVYPKKLVAARGDPGIRPMIVQTGDEGAEAAFVCDRVLDHRERGLALRDQAVLFRTGHHSARLELELARRNIPFVKYGGLKMLEAAHIKDLLSFLRVLENPSDELAWHRVLGLARGIGPAVARTVMSHLALPNPAALRQLVDGPPPVPGNARADLVRLQEAFSACMTGADPPHPPAVEIDVLRTRLQPLFEHRYRDAAVRLNDFDQLAALAASCPTRAQFLADLTLDPPTVTSDLARPPLLDDDYLILSTIHSAKGGEWDVVFVIRASDGNIPSDMALGDPDGLEEERRLFYVALTRARDHLYVSYPLRYHRYRHGLGDEHAYGQPSRFLIPARELFDERPVEADLVARSGGTPDGPDPVGAQLEALWA